MDKNYRGEGKNNVTVPWETEGEVEELLDQRREGEDRDREDEGDKEPLPEISYHHSVVFRVAVVAMALIVILAILVMTHGFSLGYLIRTYSSGEEGTNQRVRGAGPAKFPHRVDIIYPLWVYNGQTIGENLTKGEQI